MIYYKREMEQQGDPNMEGIVQVKGGHLKSDSTCWLIQCKDDWLYMKTHNIIGTKINNKRESDKATNIY